MDSTEFSSQVLPQQKVQPLCLVPVSFVWGQQSCRPLLHPVPRARPREVGVKDGGRPGSAGPLVPSQRQEPVGSRKEKSVPMGWEEPSSFSI